MTRQSHYERPDGKICDVGYVPNLARLFSELARLVSTEQRALFKTCIYTLTADGKYDVRFDYNEDGTTGSP